MLQRFMHWLFTVRTIDEEVRRRSQQIILIGLGLLVSSVIGQIAILIFNSSATLLIPILLVIELLHSGTIALARRGYAQLAALIQVSFSLLTTLIAYGLSDGDPISAAFLVFTIVVSSLTLRSIYIWPVVIASSLGLFATLPYAPLKVANSGGVVVVFILYGLVGLLAFLGARSYERAYGLVLAARREAEQSARQLAAANSGLEQRVAERTTALEGALASLQVRTTELQAALLENDQQREVIRALGVPVLPITQGTLVMPLVGELSAERLAQVRQGALQAIEQTAARRLILDITGVPIVDSAVAQGLLSVIQATQLMGASTALVGIRPEVAQAIVGLGFDLRGLATFADLQSGLEATLAT